MCSGSTYSDRFEMKWYPWWTEDGKKRASKYPFDENLHGMVVLDKEGTIVALRSGHHYDQKLIAEDFEALLAGTIAPSLTDLRERQAREAKEALEEMDESEEGDP